MVLLFTLACVRYPTEDFHVDEIRLSYSVLAEDLEEANVHVRLSLDSGPISSDLILSPQDSLYIEYDGDSYILDEKDSSIFVSADVEYIATIPYSDPTKPFTLVFERPAEQYKTDVYLANDFSVSLEEAPFALTSEEDLPVSVRWTPINTTSDIRVGVLNTDCVGYLSESVENTGEANVEIRLHDSVERVGVWDFLCPVEVYVSATTVGNTTDFEESYVRGYQKRFSYIKVLYVP